MYNFKFFTSNDVIKFQHTNDIVSPPFVFPVETSFHEGVDPTELMRFDNIINSPNTEYCFQFNEDEPVVFSTGGDRLILTLNGNNNGDIMFNQGGNTFRLFGRP